MKGIDYIVKRFKEHGACWDVKKKVLFTPGDKVSSAYCVCSSDLSPAAEPTLQTFPGLTDLVADKPYSDVYELSSTQECYYMPKDKFMELFNHDLYFKMLVLKAMSTLRNQARQCFE